MFDSSTRPVGHPLSDWASKVAESLRQRRRRKGFKNLMDLDDHMLKDIGVLRSEVERCCRLPLSADAAMELRRISLERRRNRM